MIDDDSNESHQRNEEVTSAAMRRLQFEKIDDDYYLGGNVGEEVVDSDDDISSDDEVKSHLRKLAGFQDKNEITKDAFGRKRRKSDFEDEMDDELDKSISEYASEHMSEKNKKVVEIDDKEYDEECRKADEKWLNENREMEQKMAALELLPYDVDLTDSEVDPEMPAAVLKNKNGEAIKLVYSCKRGEQFNVEERKKKQKERRMRLAASRKPEKIRRENMLKSAVGNYSKISNEGIPVKHKKKFVESSSNETSSSTKKSPLASILKTKTKEEEKNEKDTENPIKKAMEERLKEIEKNDELLYDDEEDDANERWIKERRKEERGGKDEEMEEGEADGVLSCPGCMNELTRDCQRHEIYKTQYRAMFVSNCRLEEQKMTVEKTGREKRKEKQKSKRQISGNSAPFEISDENLFTPVKCATCGTLVAMMDNDEVYHFFNVLAGYS